jgi:hypothetical protein
MQMNQSTLFILLIIVLAIIVGYLLFFKRETHHHHSHPAVIASPVLSTTSETPTIQHETVISEPVAVPTTRSFIHIPKTPVVEEQQEEEVLSFSPLNPEKMTYLMSTRYIQEALPISEEELNKRAEEYMRKYLLPETKATPKSLHFTLDDHEEQRNAQKQAMRKSMIKDNDAHLENYYKKMKPSMNSSSAIEAY